MSTIAAAPYTEVDDTEYVDEAVTSVLTAPSVAYPLSNGQVATALARAQSEFTTVPKTKIAKVFSKRTNTTFSYKYADLADILKMALPILSKNELAFTQPLKRVGNQLFVTTKLVHSSGESIESDGISVPESVSPQELGSSLTYFRRYDASSLLGISADEDEDATIAQAQSEDQPKRGRKRQEVEQNTGVEGQDREAYTDTQDRENYVPSDVPTKEETAEYAKILRGFKLDSQTLKDYILRVTGASAIKALTKSQFEMVIASLRSTDNPAALINNVGIKM